MQSGHYSQTRYTHTSQPQEEIKDPFASKNGFPERKVSADEIAEGDFQEIKQEKQK